MSNAYRDENSVPTLIGVSSSDGFTPTRLYADPTTHRLLVDLAGAGGGITSINGDTTSAQLITVGTTGTDISVNNSVAGTTTIEIPNASATARGVITTGTQTIAGTKTFSSTITGSISGNAATSTTAPSTAVLVDQTSGQTIGATGTRLTKLWATDITCTNAIAGSVTGNAGTVSNATFTTALTVNTGTLTLTANSANTSVLTIGAGAVSVSGSNTGDQSLASYVQGPASATDGAIAIYNGTTGKLVKDSGILPQTVYSNYISSQYSSGVFFTLFDSTAVDSNYGAACVVQVHFESYNNGGNIYSWHCCFLVEIFEGTNEAATTAITSSQSGVALNSKTVSFQQVRQTTVGGGHTLIQMAVNETLSSPTTIYWKAVKTTID